MRGTGRQTAWPAERTLAELFSATMQKTPNATAVLDGERRLSYAGLDAWAGTIARSLTEAGVQRGGLVGLPARRSMAFVAAMLAILKAGAAYVPLDTDDPPERQEARRADCDATLTWPGANERALEAGILPVVTRQQPAGDPRTWPVAESDNAGMPAYVLYTSGSTGQPKGVVVPHRAVTRLVVETDYVELKPDDVIAFHSNLSFDASTFEIWGALLNGGAMVVTATEEVLSAPDLAAHLERHGITTLWLTTSLFARLAEQAPGMFGGLRWLLFGGEAANAEAVRKVWENGRPEHFINGYGPTETTTFAVCQTIRDEDAETGRIPIGRPIANTDAYILDATLEPAEEGELHIGGAGVALGYLNRPELTAQRFVETRFGRLYRTGDLARWRADGTIDYLGRLDRQIKMRGFRIEPGEIESALRGNESVTECAVVVRRHAGGDAFLAAYYAGAAEPESLRNWLREKLPPQMVPAAWCSIPELPLTANGKLDGARLPEATVLAPATQAISAPPGTASEREVAQVWQEVLELPAVGIDDNFFDLGGTSLSLLRVHAALHKAPGRERLKIVALFQHPTVRTLARFLEGAAAIASAAPRGLAAEMEARAARRREALQQRRRPGNR